MAEDKYLPLADYDLDCSKGRHSFRMENLVDNLSCVKENRLGTLKTFFQLGEVECGSCHQILRVYAVAVAGLDRVFLTGGNILLPQYLMNWHPLTQEILDLFNSLPEAEI